MTAALLYKPEHQIDVAQLSNFELFDSPALTEVVSLFEKGVQELRTFIETTGAIIHCPVSQGKDSTIVELMAIEAYRQSISDGKIPADLPLILSTVDTGGEVTAMRMYVRYAHKRILKYAKEIGINIIYDIVRPPLNDEYFVKYVGGQKLIPNATRHGDCSIILKVDPSQRYVKSLLNKFLNDNEHDKNKISKVITCVGSRLDEGSRRSNNMSKQGISKKSAEDLLNELQVDLIGKHKLYKFAPIKDWTTEQVFDALRIAGSNPLLKIKDKPGIAIPGFLPDYALLLLIYGNGSNETCEISVGSNASSGCNGKSRFGCVFCTMVAVTDHSSTALSQLPRWDSLGSGNALRVRDYLFRLSIDINARALHARAFDPVCYNRVAMQPNTLKPKFLEKLVRYASQLSLDSLRIAKEFKLLVEQGREMEHPGYRDIALDPNIPPRTKRSFLEMYKEGAQDPSVLNALFSEKHAVLLSLRWAIDGIGAAAYRPLAIWSQLERGEGWIPYPALNSEYEKKHGPLSLRSSIPLPEAVMMPIYKYESLQEHALAPQSLLDLWSRPFDVSDIYEKDANCSINQQSNNLANCDITYESSCSLSLVDLVNAKWPLAIKIQTSEGLKAVNVDYTGSVVSKVTINGKSISSAASDKLTKNGITDEIAEHSINLLENICKQLNDKTPTMTEVEAVLNKSFSLSKSIRRHIPHLRLVTLFTGFTDVGRKTVSPAKFTRRVVKITAGKKMEKGNTRMTFYPHSVDSKLYSAHKQETVILTPDFATHTMKSIGTHDSSTLADEAAELLENIFVDDAKLLQWKFFGGLQRALQMHDDHFDRLIKKRHTHKHSNKSLRQYGGTHVAEQLLAEGVITIDRKYWNQLLSILKRTHVFNELGLFSFQSLSAAEVASHPKAITMKQHRHDKAKILLEIRNFRNSQRKIVRENLMSVSISNCVSHFENAAINAIHAMTHELNASIFKLSFDTHDVAPSVRASASSLWLNLYLEDFNHIDDLISLLLTPVQFKNLKSSPTDYIVAGKIALEMLNNINVTIKDSLSVWEPLLTELKSILSTPCSDLLTQVKSSILQHAADHEYSDANALLQGWRPNNVTLTKQLIQAIALTDSYSMQLTAVQLKISGLYKKQLQQITHKMSLSDKLALMKKQAG